mgnify:CR=1 FL=1
MNEGTRIFPGLVSPFRRFLTVCEGGNCRSVALARVLKISFGQPAISLGWRYASLEMWRMLGAWAEYIVLMEESFLSKVPDEFSSKYRVLDVGPDIYGIPTHAVLYGMCFEAAIDWSKRDFLL